MNEYFNITEINNSHKLNIEFNLQEAQWKHLIAEIKHITVDVSKYLFSELGLNKYATSVEYSIVLTNNTNIQQINFQYRKRNAPTNVLSFPLEEIEANKFDQLKIHDGFVILGDIIFAYEVIKKEAEEKNITFEDHYTHLLIHGILHCLGYDHEDENEAYIMENMEVQILSHFKIKSPYIIKL